MDKNPKNAPVVTDWFDHPQNLRRLRLGFYLVLVLLVVPDLLLHKHTLFHSAEGWPGFYAVFGYISCVVIIVVSKLLGYLLKRKEGYYD